MAHKSESHQPSLFDEETPRVELSPAQVLPKGFHRIRHYGLLAGRTRAETIAKARHMLAAGVNPEMAEIDEDVASAHAHPCPCCGGRMIIVELFEPGCQPQHQPITPRIRIDTS